MICVSLWMSSSSDHFHASKREKLWLTYICCCMVDGLTRCVFYLWGEIELYSWLLTIIHFAFVDELLLFIEFDFSCRDSYIWHCAVHVIYAGRSWLHQQWLQCHRQIHLRNQQILLNLSQQLTPDQVHNHKLRCLLLLHWWCVYLH